MKTAVIGYGSAHGDDQVGWKVVELISKIESLKLNIHCVYSDGNGLDWMQQLQGISKVIFIDAVKSGAEPGSVMQISAEELRSQPASQYFTSSHRYPLQQSIDIAIALKLLNVPYAIYGIEIDNIMPFTKISETVMDAANDLVEIIVRQCAKSEE